MSNHITIIGNVGQEPEVRVSTSGMAVVKFTVADTYGKDDKKKTTWHNVVVFGQLGENVSNTIHKGDSVILTGRMEVEEYTKKDGTKGKSTQVIVDDIGVSLRWNVWVKDQTADTVAKVGKVFSAPAGFDDF